MESKAMASDPFVYDAIEVLLIAIFHYFCGIGTCNFHEATPIRIAVTSVYIILIIWGLHIGNNVVYNCRKSKDKLANPSLARDYPGRIFNAHFLICVLHTLVLGPYFIINGYRQWYWTSFVTMLFASIPIVQFNYNPESFGNAVGTFVKFRNVFELFLSLYLAVTLDDDAESFRKLAVYHYFVWGYRLLDVGPRRLMKKMLVPGPIMLAVLIIIYIAAFAAVHYDLVMFAGSPICGDFEAEEPPLMMAARIFASFAVYFFFFGLQRNYIQKEVSQAETKFDCHPPPPFGYHDDNVAKKRKEEEKND